MKYYIYHITNSINGKKYVGQTLNINRRFNTHKNKLKENIHHSIKLQSAWNKYGEENFIFSYQIFDCSQEKINELEIEEIKKYDSYNNGYNMTEGGDGIRNLSKEKKRNLLEALCVGRKYPLCSHAIEQYFGWHKNTMSPLLRGTRYQTIWEDYENLSLTERDEIADNKYKEWNIEKILKERLSTRGNFKNWTLSKEDYNFIFSAQELGYKYTAIGKYYELNPATVKDWLSGRTKKDKKQNYLSLSEKEKEYYKDLVKSSDLYKFVPLQTTEKKLNELLLYLSLKEANIEFSEAAFERKFDWAAGTCNHIKKPELYLQAKEYFNHLTPSEKQNLINIY